MDLGNKTQVTGIKTQGQEHDTCQWVKSYTISYSNDGINFTAYKQNVVCREQKLTFALEVSVVEVLLRNTVNPRD